jgi:hypothetical protein
MLTNRGAAEVITQTRDADSAARDAARAFHDVPLQHERRMTTLRGPAMCASPGSTYEGVDAMGRGRQKAKQTKVARELKYFSPNTDYSALQRELAGSNGEAVEDTLEEDHEDESSDDDDEYADWAPGTGR